MLVYTLLARVFPRSFTAKLFFLAFIGTHVPLLVLIVRLVMSGDHPGQTEVLALILVATLVGTGATLAAMQAILRPLYRIEAALRGFEETGQIAQLPSGHGDEIGRLMDRTTRLMRRVSDRISATQRRADTDPLTGVLNRRGFYQAVATLGSGAVIHFDLDHFKSVNDNFGHDTGDRVLEEVARVAVGVLRTGDLLARFGGEEFVAFLPGASRADAQAVAERLRGAIEAGVRAGNRAVTASVGASDGPGSMAEMLNLADAATYASKRDGRNRVTLAWAA